MRLNPDLPENFPSGGSGGSGVGGTPTGTPPGITAIGGPIGENGGVFATSWFLFFPMTDLMTGRTFFGILDVESFDDIFDGSSYSYRVEDIGIERVPTVRRVLLVYRDLGLATVTVKLEGTNDNREVVSKSVQKQIGNSIPTRKLLSALVDVQLTCFRPQLTVSRVARGGPFSIISASMVGEAEEVTL